MLVGGPILVGGLMLVGGPMLVSGLMLVGMQAFSKLYLFVSFLRNTISSLLKSGSLIVYWIVQCWVSVPLNPQHFENDIWKMKNIQHGLVQKGRLVSG